jgi:D-3-phosphoglycerate dehydrogenase
MFQLLREAGINFDYQPKISKSKFDDIISNYEILIIRSKFKIQAEDIDKGKNLKIIGRVGAGLENIDIDYAQSRNIICLNSPEGNRDAVGEHAVGMLLNLMNKIPKAHKEIQQGIWDREANWGVEISDKTIGIIGYGNMGKAFAQRIKGFSHNILAYDKYKKNFSDEYITEASMEEIFDQVDILSLHVPLTQETKYLISEDYIKSFKKNIILINTARGECVNSTALVSALKSQKIKGACLDVLEYEKTTFEEMFSKDMPEALKYLIESKNVILTPHVAGWTNEAYVKLSRVMAEKVIKLSSI